MKWKRKKKTSVGVLIISYEQKALEKGREEGIKQGMKQGMKQGIKQGMRQGMKRLVQTMSGKGWVYKTS